MRRLGNLIFIILFTAFMIFIATLFLAKLDTASIIVGIIIATINNLLLRK